MGLPDSNNTSALLKNLSKDLERMRVLIIDRHSSARHSLRVILSTLDISAIHNAGTSAEVMRQVKAYDFDIIFADYMLDDGRDGQQLLEELRQKHLISLSTVYMVITAERAYQNVVSVAELAPDDYLIKPFTAEQLQARLMKALYKKRFFERVFTHLDNGAFADAVNKGLMSNDLMSKVIIDTVAASDARMDGAMLPAMSNSGSGNQRDDTGDQENGNWAVFTDGEPPGQ
mgnify:CR=1 FL=1